MTKRSVMIVGAGRMQIVAIETARSMGFTVIASDGNPRAAGLAVADVPLVLDTKDIDGHVAFAKANRDRLNIAGAFAAADMATTVAAITTALGLPGIPPLVAHASHNKAAMKQRWLAAGVPTPHSIEVRSLEEARRALERVGLPAMIKAVDNAASRGSRRVDDDADLAEAIADARRNSTTSTALVEQLVEGDEQSVETIVYGGRHHRFGIVDRHFGFIPYAIEVGHTNPSRLPDEAQDAIYDVVHRAANALGITFGPAKADMILTKNGPMVLEMPARLSGGWHSQYTTPLALGLDPIRVVLTLATGGTITEANTVPRWHRTSICKAVFPRPGIVRRIGGVEEARRLPGVEQVIVVVEPGEMIPEYRHCGHRPCYIITVGETPDQAEARWHAAAGTVCIETEPID